MFTGLRTFFRLLWRTLFQSKGTHARITPRRLIVMALFLPVFFAMQLMHWIGLCLDDIFFSGYKRIEVKEPLFVVGIPRSGTTLLHRALALDTDRFTTFKMWELILAPSVTQKVFWIGLAKLDRLLGGPCAWLIGAIERVVFRKMGHVHKISLTAPEEDFLLLVPIYACFILTVPFPFPEEFGHLAYFDDKASEAEKQRVMSFYKACLQRHLYIAGPGRRLLSKNASFTPMIQSLNDTFPDCKFIGTLRDPKFTIPSQISSMESAWEMFGNDSKGTAFRDQFIDMFKYYYTHLTGCMPQWPQNRQALLTMEELKDNLDTTIQNIYNRFGFDMTDKFSEKLQTESERSRNYASKHNYSLAQYGINPDDIRNEFAGIYEKFKFGGQSGVSDNKPDPEKNQAGYSPASMK